MKLHKLIFTENACFAAGRRITPKGIMVHSTGANNPNLRRYVGPDDGLLGVNKYGNHWNCWHPGGDSDLAPHDYVDKNKDGKCDICGGRQVCVHGFIGKLSDGSVATYQVLPWDMRGWHGGGSSNDTHIGFEICEDALTDGAYFGKVYREAVELCVMLCREFGLTEKDIIDHSEGHDLGIASNHGDVKHWLKRFGMTMDDFRADVGKLLEESFPFEDVPEGAWYRDAVEWAWQKGITVGRDESHFDPESPITRAEMAAMLYRMEGGGNP